jgi:DNA-binding protein HU-beta
VSPSLQRNPSGAAKMAAFAVVRAIDLAANRLAAAIIDAITDAVRSGEKVSITGFGNFERRERAARTARNPQTGAEIQVPASKAPAFKAGKAFKDAVNI